MISCFLSAVVSSLTSLRLPVHMFSEDFCVACVSVSTYSDIVLFGVQFMLRLMVTEVLDFIKQRSSNRASVSPGIDTWHAPS
jgi:hypothetical protein